MAIEFVTMLDVFTFPDSQVLPFVYNFEGYNGRDHVYIVSSDGYRFRVNLKTPRYGQWYLYGEKWREFCNRYLDEEVEVLHFVEEGNDCFYVTGYYGNGKEACGYEGPFSSFSRFKISVLPYPHVLQTIPGELMLGLGDEDEIRVVVNGVSFGCNVRRDAGSTDFQLVADSFNAMIESVGLEAETLCVLTKNRGRRFWFDAFSDDGSMITDPGFKGAATLRRQQLQLTGDERQDDRMKHVCYWPFYMDHFGEGHRSFYKSYARIQAKSRLAIPASFLVENPMHTYNRILIIHQEYRDEFRVRMEFHPENPTRTNHVTVCGRWKLLADSCRFPYSKLIRFKYVGNGYTVDAPEGENPAFPIFHIC